MITGARPDRNTRQSEPRSECDAGLPTARNPYAKPFPRAGMWTPRELSGLSGERQPDGWVAEKQEAILMENRDNVTAKELYAKLVAAGPPRIAPEVVVEDMLKPTSPMRSTGRATYHALQIHKYVLYCYVA